MTMRRFSALWAAFASKLVNSILSVRRLLVVVREQHNEVSRVLNGLVQLLDKVRSNRNVVILRANPIAVLLENVGDLARNSGHRAPTAQEKVVSLTGTAWHRGDPCCSAAMVVRRMRAVKGRRN